MATPIEMSTASSTTKAFDGKAREVVRPLSLLGSSAPSSPLVTTESTLPVGNNVFLTLGHDGLIVEDPAYEEDDDEDDGFLQNYCCMPCDDPPKTPGRTIPYFNILWADVKHDAITIKHAQERTKDIVTATSLHYPTDPEHKSAADTWCARLLDLAYGRAQRCKRIKVLVNPFGGKGQATQIYLKLVEPIFAAANCDIEVEETKYRGHGTVIAENIDADAYDVIAACSGDGIPCEVFNGLAKKADAGYALRKLAVVNIPCGSGNAMSCNLNGTSSPSMGALCVVKGIRTPLDLVSITQGENRMLSFLSQSFGIIAECDLGTDKIRWMGASRFHFGFLVRLIRQSCWPADLAVKVELGDKDEIRKHYRAHVARAQEEAAPTQGSESSTSASTSTQGKTSSDDETASDEAPPEDKGLPPLRYGRVTDPLPDGWTLIPFENLGNFYCGNMAYMSPDANFFTSALPNDGMVDLITIPGDLARRTVLGMMFALEDNSLFDLPDVKVQKVSGYRLIPRQKDGYISIDGERIPFEPFQAEVHKGLGMTLSRWGYKYAAPGPSEKSMI